MKDLLKDKVAVLTGAGGGIGSAVAERLARHGMKIVLFGGRNREKLTAAQAAVEKHSACLVLPGDVTEPEFITCGIAETVETFGGIDVLINNAGAAQNTPFENVSIEEFDKLMAINVRAPFLMMRAALPHLKKSEAAAIVNICSVVSHSGYPMQSIYSASKHALLGLTKSLAREYYKEGIRVHAVSPGGVYTDMVKVSRPDLSPEGMIMPGEIAAIVEFLLVNRGNAVIDEILVHRVGKEPFLV
jgi:3-oxoacyl-[acyl-carrier protein] reductase